MNYHCFDFIASAMANKPAATKAPEAAIGELPIEPLTSPTIINAAIND